MPAQLARLEVGRSGPSDLTTQARTAPARWPRGTDHIRSRSSSSPGRSQRNASPCSAWGSAGFLPQTHELKSNREKWQAKPGAKSPHTFSQCSTFPCKLPPDLCFRIHSTWVSRQGKLKNSLLREHVVDMNMQLKPHNLGDLTRMATPGV